MKTILAEFLNENSINISKKEFEEAKDFFKNGGKLENDAVPYQIFIRKDGERVFYINDVYKFFKNEDAFIRAAIRVTKRGF